MTASQAEGTIIGIDVGGTKTAVVEGTHDARILLRSERPTQGALPFAETWPALRDQIARTIAESLRNERRPYAISVAVGGPLVAGEGRLLAPPNLPGWRDVALADRLREQFPNLAVFVEHDAKAGAMAEFRFGVGVSRPWLKDIVFLTFGTGLGAGIIVHSRLVRGAHELAGEIWGLSLHPPNGAKVREIADWESAASGRGIAYLGAQLYPSRWPDGTATSDIVAAALAGDGDAGAVIAECGRWLGAGLAVLIATLDPQMIVLGSLAVVLGDRVLTPARHEVVRQLGGHSGVECPIVPSALGSRLGDVQSLMAAIDALTGS